MNAERIERAAGGVVVRRQGEMLEVLFIHDAYGHVTFPKGHVETGETWEEAALREISEETGIKARIVAPLGRVEYPIERDGKSVRKQVRFFLLEAMHPQQTPVAQAEEVSDAFFLPWADAEQRHSANGYDNWSFVLDKAKVLWKWYEADRENEWRHTSAGEALPNLTEKWKTALPSVQSLVETVATELSVVAPQWFEEPPSPALSAYQLPLAQGALPSLRSAIEHTLLKPEASLLDVMKLVNEAKDHHFGGVCVNPQYAQDIVQDLAGTATVPCVVVGFPLGATATPGLAEETSAVVRAGVQEVDMVIPVGSMREDDIWSVYERVAAVADRAHAQNAKVKVILETHFLTFEQVIKASFVALAAGADFLKTSTGFAQSGAKIMDVAVMKTIAGTQAAVKAAGGIRSYKEAQNFLHFGAARLGTSSGISLVREQPLDEAAE